MTTARLAGASLRFKRSYPSAPFLLVVPAALRRREAQQARPFLLHLRRAAPPGLPRGYGLNLKRKFPRLPFYEDFRQWAAWGRTLMELHLGYEQAAPFPLARHDRKAPVSKQTDLLPDERAKPKRLLDDKPALKPRLKALKDEGAIEIDATTTLRGIPPEAWAYKLGNRSALEWVLDQWKEHKISDPTVAEKFNTYRFADHKEPVIDLLHRVCTVSVETMKIVRAMPG